MTDQHYRPANDFFGDTIPFYYGDDMNQFELARGNVVFDSFTQAGDIYKRKSHGE